ncbi:MAG: hypothetical protein HY081_06895 [Gammaproteobacteria bacterium]|nr:hypothetical protein [Gammaproteobacteria bacterium]
MRMCKRIFILLIMLIAPYTVGAGQRTITPEDLLNPAPLQPKGYYDYFGKLMSPLQAYHFVEGKGLDPRLPKSYLRLGLIKITDDLLKRGEDIFMNRTIGDYFGRERVIGFSAGFTQIAPDLFTAIAALNGKPTTNLKITLSHDVTLGSTTVPQGTVVSTGLDVEAGASLPLGILPDASFSCAMCHAAVDMTTGKRVNGVPNNDLNLGMLIATSPNDAAAFARISINPLDPALQGNGKTIINSKGELVTLPDPVKLETLFDNILLALPAGMFESSPDGINNPTQIPSLFTFRSGPYESDGVFGVGPFAGLSAFSNAVHSSEINFMVAFQNSERLIGIDPELYIGVALQNAVDLSLRLPAGAPVKPSEWMRSVAPVPGLAELEAQIAVPGVGQYPLLQPNLFTLNGLVFSPDSNSNDIAAGPFLFAANAMAAWQNSLTPPPNRSFENKQALASGSVKRGARVFLDAGCASCHTPPYFTDNKIHPVQEIGTNPARAQSRLGLESILVSPLLYSFDTPVPVPANAEVLKVPTAGFSPTPTSLPFGLSPAGGYKTTPLRGIAYSAPYLHDGGVAVRAGALSFNVDGGFTLVDPSGLGLPGTLSQTIQADAASSLRALVDRNLRGQVIVVNRMLPYLAFLNLDGTGHNFYVDPSAGFSYRQQADLVNFLMALDDNPGTF